MVSSDVLMMGLSNNVLVLIELSRDDQVVQIAIPRKTTEFSIYKLFLDPSGRHLIITSTQGENWYLYRGWKKPRQLKSFKMVIESVAWNKSALLNSTHSTSTREILIGGRNGTIYEAVLDAQEDFFKSQERYFQSVFTLPERHPVTGLRFDFFPPMDQRKALVLVTTATRIYQFVGTPDKRSEEGGRVFSRLFANYSDSAPSKLAYICILAAEVINRYLTDIKELAGDIEHSELHAFNPNADQALSLPRSIAWMTGAFATVYQFCCSSLLCRLSKWCFPWNSQFRFTFRRLHRRRTVVALPSTLRLFAYKLPTVHSFNRVPFHSPLQG